MSLVRAMETLRDAYPSASFGDATLAQYARSLSDLDEARALEAVEFLVKNGGPFLPSISDIRRTVAEQALHLPSTAQAWELAVAGGTALKHAPEPVRTAASHVGGSYGIRSAENTAVLRGQFQRVYVEERQAAIQTYADQGALPAPPPKPELGPTMQALPESERIRPRPLVTRFVSRLGGEQVGPPTEEEQRDAIAYLRAGPNGGDPADDALYREAERVFAEAGVDGP